jgi:ubiquinone/menaquinone biosynthesis C-methylase UbiE
MQSILFGLGALPYAALTLQPTWRAHGGELAALCGASAGDRILDLGCGPGVSAFGMLDRVPGARVVGLDLSPTMVRFANLRQTFERARGAVEFVRGDAMRLPFDDASFDAVTGHSFLYLVPDLARVLAEVRRVLRPGRRCVFLEPSTRARRFPRAMALRALREPRFVTSMALWRVVSRGYGRFDRARFERGFGGAGLELVECRDTLEGLGVFGVGRRPPEG